MTPEKMLEAMTDLEDTDIQGAREPRTRRNPAVRRLAVLAAAVVALMAMTITALATINGLDWFRNFFTQRSDDVLTEGQLAYIEENTREISQSVTQNGYTITVESAISDGYTAYIKLKFTAPEGVVLDAEGYFDTMEIGSRYFYPADDSDSSPSSGTWQTLDDGNNQDNSVSILITRHGSGFLDGKVWRLEITDIEASYPDFTRDRIIAEGVWGFDIIFTDVRSEEVELLSEPLSYKAKIYRNHTEFDYVDTQITSVKLRPMSGTMLIEHDHAAGFSVLTVVMKDGSTAELNANGLGNGEIQYTTNVPLSLEEVSHVLLPDGTKLMMPE